jgi:hypothetical protein
MSDLASVAAVIGGSLVSIASLYYGYRTKKEAEELAGEFSEKKDVRHHAGIWRKERVEYLREISQRLVEAKAEVAYAQANGQEAEAKRAIEHTLGLMLSVDFEDFTKPLLEIEGWEDKVEAALDWLGGKIWEELKGIDKDL